MYKKLMLASLCAVATQSVAAELSALSHGFAGVMGLVGSTSSEVKKALPVAIAMGMAGGMVIRAHAGLRFRSTRSALDLVAATAGFALGRAALYYYKDE